MLEINRRGWLKKQLQRLCGFFFKDSLKDFALSKTVRRGGGVDKNQGGSGATNESIIWRSGPTAVRPYGFTIGTKTAR